MSYTRKSLFQGQILCETSTVQGFISGQNQKYFGEINMHAITPKVKSKFQVDISMVLKPNDSLTCTIISPSDKLLILNRKLYF